MSNGSSKPRGIIPAVRSNSGRGFQRGWKAFAILLVCVWTLAVSVLPIHAQPSGDAVADAGPIQITADELVSQIKDNYAEFIGNVEAVQGDFEIRSDRLQIHYRRKAGQSVSDPASGEAIEKIVAIGRVRIKSGSREARTELAEYLVDEGLLVLKGENSTVKDGNNSIRGSVIKLNRADGKISVAGGPSQRVRAVFHSSGVPPTGDETDDKADEAAPAPQP